MRHFLHGLKLKGIAAAYPRQTEDLSSLSETFGHEEVKRIIASTGIRRIRKAPLKMCASDLCQAAAEALLAELDVERRSIDGILFLSQTPDWRLPATSCALQNRLELDRETVTMDISSGCTAYIHGLFQAGLLIQSGACERVLICAGDVITRLVSPRDKATRMVFGDAGSATIMEKTEEPGNWPFLIRSDGTGGHHLMVEAGGARLPHSPETAIEKKCESGNRRAPENIYMNGMEILNFSLREVPPAVEETKRMLGWSDEELENGALILHQANKFMVDYLRRKMRLPQESVPVAVSEAGNTGPASIPLTLAVHRQVLKRQNRLRKTLMCGFGAGLSWGVTGADLSQTVILDPIELE